MSGDVEDPKDQTEEQEDQVMSDFGDSAADETLGKTSIHWTPITTLVHETLAQRT